MEESGKVRQYIVYSKRIKDKIGEKTRTKSPNKKLKFLGCILKEWNNFFFNSNPLKSIGGKFLLIDKKNNNLYLIIILFVCPLITQCTLCPANTFRNNELFCFEKTKKTYQRHYLASMRKIKKEMLIQYLINNGLFSSDEEIRKRHIRDTV